MFPITFSSETICCSFLVNFWDKTPVEHFSTHLSQLPVVVKFSFLFPQFRPFSLLYFFFKSTTEFRGRISHRTERKRKSTDKMISEAELMVCNIISLIHKIFLIDRRRPHYWSFYSSKFLGVFRIYSDGNWNSS